MSSAVHDAVTGYYRFPTIHGDRIAFVAEDDVWTVPVAGGVAHRLTANPGRFTHPAFSPDGQQLAITGTDEGQTEVYVMPASGGPAQRLTYFGPSSFVVGWRPDGSSILFASDAKQPHLGHWHQYEVSPDGGEARAIPVGPALTTSCDPNGDGMVLGRTGGGRRRGDPAMWKRYRGGTAGTIWIDSTGNGRYRPLIKLDGDLAAPMWIGNRIYFLSDHEGVGNIYSCKTSGKDLRRETDHEAYYVRYPRTDGERIVYASGADLYVLDIASAETTKVDIVLPSARPQRNRKFVGPRRYTTDFAVHPQGHKACTISRGRPFTFALWEGAVVQHGKRDGVRYRLAQWLWDGKKLIAVSDEGGEEHLVVFTEDGKERALRWPKDLGRITGLDVAPKGPDRIAVRNHRQELLLLDLGKRTRKRIDHSGFGAISDVAWAPDGRWIAYTKPESHNTAGVKLFDVEKGKAHAITRPDFKDQCVAFDGKGDYLYFTSIREYDPVFDSHHFELSFPRGVRVLAIPLRKDLASPFLPVPRPPGGAPPKPDAQKEEKKKKKEQRIKIDLDGIADRVVGAPLPEGLYEDLAVVGHKVLFTSWPIEGSRGDGWSSGPGAPRGTLEAYDLRQQKRETLLRGINHFELSANGATMLYRHGYDLRAVKAGEKVKDDDDEPGRESGWLNLSRIRVSVDPGAEWAQMFDEAWRLQRDNFWTQDMSGLDWAEVRTRYRPLVDRVSTRAELSDLLWEVQGELGTSHAYELLGEYRPAPVYRQGLLGADVSYDTRAKVWRIDDIPQGDSWNRTESSPLAAPGVNLKPRSRLLAVGGQPVDASVSPAQCLVNTASQEVDLQVADPGGRNARTITIRTLGNEQPLRYRAWVEANRAHVHEATKGQVGYLHVPDMGPDGYAEFHRYFLAEVEHQGLIVDVRFNGGGNVSPLLLEKLLRRRVGYDLSRWGEPVPYPYSAPLGPMVALTNENAGSDGDIFSHCFKLYGLGPLIGKRTWGGVIGIWPRHVLVDGTITTQPEFAFCFEDVGYLVENYGTDPDIEVEYPPQDYASGHDPQLARAIKEVQSLIRKRPHKMPNMSKRPKLPSAKLPKRKR